MGKKQSYDFSEFEAESSKYDFSEFDDALKKKESTVGGTTESVEPLEQSEGTTTTSSSETQSPTQEQSGEGIDFDYFISQAPKSTEVDSGQEQPKETYDPEYIAEEEAKLSEEFNRVKQLEKEVAKNTGGYETDISALRDSVDMEIKSVSDSISSEFDIINKQVSDSVLAELDVRKAQLQEQINSGNISVEDANKILSEESDKYKVEAKKSIDSKKPELAAALNKRVSEINNAYQSSLNELQDKQNIYNKQKQEKEIEEMSPWENIGRAFQNEWTKTKMIPAQSIQVASQLTPEGNEKETRVIIDANGIRLVEQTPAEGQIYNRNQLEELRKEIEPTKQIIKSIKDGDYSGAASAVVGSTVNFAGSMVRALASRGASMGAEMGEPMWESAVKAEAEKTGKTPEEVITEDLEDELTAMSLGAVSVLSERFGVKAFKNVMQKNVFKKAVKDEINKKAPSLLSASLKETGTELFQGGIEKGNEEILKGDDGLYSLEGGSILYNEMKNFIASEEGAETAISTFLGSMMLSGGSKGAMAVYNNINKNPKDITAPSIDEILKDRDNAAASFNELYESGKLSEDDYNSSLNLITTVFEYDSKLSKDNTNRAESIKLMMERDSKAEELSQLDETQQAGVKKEIEDINLELEKLSAQKEETDGKEEATEQPTADVQEGKRDSEEVQQEEDIEELRRAELEPIELAIAKSNETGEVPTVNGNLVGKDDINRINEKYDAKIAELKSKQGGKEVQQEDSEVKTFAKRIANGEDVTAKEDAQFYENNKAEVEAELKTIQDLEVKAKQEEVTQEQFNDALAIIEPLASQREEELTLEQASQVQEALGENSPLSMQDFSGKSAVDVYNKLSELKDDKATTPSKSATQENQGVQAEQKVDEQEAGAKQESKPKEEAKEAESRKARKKELRNKFFNTLNDASRIPTLLADPEFYEYAGMVLEDAVGDFKKFSKEMIKVLGKDIEPELKNIYDKVSLESNKNIDEEGTQSKEQNKDSQKSDGKKGKLRGFAESVLGDKRVKSLSKLRENIKQNPENYYDPQTWAEIQENLDNLSEDELIESMNQTGINIVSDGNNNNAVLAAVEVINRRLAEGKPIDDIVERFAKEGTRMGQLIAQFATLKNSTPAGIMMTLEKFAEKEGKAFTKKQKADLTKLAESMLKSNNKLDAFIKDKGGNATKEDIKTLNELKKQAEKDTKKFYDKSSGFIPMSWSDMTKMTLQGNLLTPMSQATNIVANIAQQGLMIPVDIVSNMSDLVQSIFTGKRTGSLDPMKYVAGWIGAAKGLKEAWGILLKGDSSYAKGEVKKSFRPLTAFTQAISDTKLGDAFGIESGLLPKTLSKKGIELMKESKRALMDGDLEKSSELRDRALSESGIDRNDRLKKIYESFFGAAPEVMFRLLALGDKPFYYFTQYKQLYTQGKRKGLSGQQLRNFVMLPDAKTLEDVNESAAEAVFMEEGLLSKTAIDITNFIEKKAKSVPRIGGALSFLFRTTIPYVKTPSNIISQTIDFVLPPVALGKAVHAYSKGDVKQGNKNIGIFTTGIIMSQVAGMLIAEGLISSPFDFGDDPEDEQNIKRAVGFPPDHLNLSGLKRLLNGKGTELQEGDEVINLKKLGILGAIILIRSSQSEDTYKAEKSKYVNIKDDLGFWDKVSKEGGKYINLGAVPATTKYATEQSFLAGTASLLDAITGGDYETKRWVKQTLGAVSVIGAPNTFSAIDRATETYLHDMRSDNTHSMLESLIVSKIYPPKKIVGIDIYKDFPVRVDMWGEKIKRTPDGKNPLFHQLFDVSKSQTVPHDEKSLEIYNVYRQTLNTKVVPNLPSRIISYNGKKYKVLKDKEHNTLYNEYAAVLGKSRAKMMDKLMSKSSYKESNIERKSELIEKYLSIADKNRDVIKAKRALVDGLDKLAE